MKKRILAIFLSLTLLSITSSFQLGSAAVEPINVTGLGIFDQTPNKGIHTFENGARLIQVRFSGDFYDPAQLSGARSCGSKANSEISSKSTAKRYPSGTP